MRESSLILMVVILIAVLLFAAAVTGNSWPSPGFMAFILACWLIYVLTRHR